MRADMQTSGDSPQVVLGFETALLYWRAVHEGRLAMPTQTPLTELPQHCLTGFKELLRFDFGKLCIYLTQQGMLSRYTTTHVACCSGCAKGLGKRPTPMGLGAYPGAAYTLHVLTGSRHRRHPHSAINAHLVTGKLPTGCLYRISGQLLVVSPELAFVQCCRSQNGIANMELAFELCGRYGLMTAELPCRFHLTPLTTVDKLANCARACRGRWGAHEALRALSWASDGMRSPRETELFLMLVLSRTVGGFGLPRPSVNFAVPFEGTTAKVLERITHYEVDLVWEDKRVVLEYDGYAEHEADDATVAADKERRSALAALGYMVIIVTKRDFASERSLAAKVAQVGIALGLTIEPFSQSEASAHKKLFSWLANPMHDHLPLGYGYH